MQQKSIPVLIQSCIFNKCYITLSSSLTCTLTQDINSHYLHRCGRGSNWDQGQSYQLAANQLYRVMLQQLSGPIRRWTCHSMTPLQQYLCSNGMVLNTHIHKAYVRYMLKQKKVKITCINTFMQYFEIFVAYMYKHITPYNNMQA